MEQNDLPAGYAPAPPPPPQEPAVKYERLMKGREVVFLKTREITAKKSGEAYTLHVFRDVLTGRNFETFGCAALDYQLSVLKPLTRIYLRYNGKLPDDKGREVHDFTVGVATVQEPPPHGDDDLPF